jgi:hypothetical protein
MKFFISLGLALSLPFLSFAQKVEKTIFGNITDVYFTYKFNSNFDDTQFNKLGLGIELYENFDLEFLTSFNKSNSYYFLEDIGLEEQDVTFKGQSYGLALSFRALPEKKLRPVVGLGFLSGSYKSEKYYSNRSYTHFYGRIGIEYQVLDYLVLSGNTNISISNSTRGIYNGPDYLENPDQLVSFSARLSFMDIK